MQMVFRAKFMEKTGTVEINADRPMAHFVSDDKAFQAYVRKEYIDLVEVQG